ncbi:MAG: malectin [Verrucomicrobiota bacterium]
MRNILTQTVCVCATAGMFTFVTGCQTNNQGPAPSAPVAVQTPVPPAAAVQTPAAVQAPAAVQTPAAPAAAVVKGVIRIKAGSSEPFKDSSGNVWQAEQGFSGGDVVERDASTAIANTKDPGLFLSEHYSMDSFSCAVPNGKYIAKLYFAETFEGVSGPGGRVFSFNVQGHEFKDFDVFVKAGGANRAYVETVPVEVTDGKFKITFTSNVENPEINAIELTAQN